MKSKPLIFLCALLGCDSASAPLPLDAAPEERLVLFAHSALTKGPIEGEVVVYVMELYTPGRPLSDAEVILTTRDGDRKKATTNGEGLAHFVGDDIEGPVDLCAIHDDAQNSCWVGLNASILTLGLDTGYRTPSEPSRMRPYGRVTGLDMLEPPSAEKARFVSLQNIAFRYPGDLLHESSLFLPEQDEASVLSFELQVLPKLYDGFVALAGSALREKIPASVSYADVTHLGVMLEEPFGVDIPLDHPLSERASISFVGFDAFSSLNPVNGWSVQLGLHGLGGPTLWLPEPPPVRPMLPEASIRAPALVDAFSDALYTVHVTVELERASVELNLVPRHNLDFSFEISSVPRERPRFEDRKRLVFDSPVSAEVNFTRVTLWGADLNTWNVFFFEPRGAFTLPKEAEGTMDLIPDLQDYQIRGLDPSVLTVETDVLIQVLWTRRPPSSL